MANISRTPNNAGPQAQPASIPLAADGSERESDVDYDNDGYPLRLTTPHIDWIKNLLPEYVKLPKNAKSKERTTWFAATIDDFCKTFPKSWIGNSRLSTKTVRQHMCYIQSVTFRD